MISEENFRKICEEKVEIIQRMSDLKAIYIYIAQVKVRTYYQMFSKKII